MPINPSIAMSFQAPKFEDPMNNMLKMEQMKAYQQNALAKQIEMQAAQETLGEQRGLRNYLAGLGAGTSPDVNQLARFGEAGQQYSQKMAAAEKDRFEIASKLYKEVYLPQLGQATTRNDVLSWHASMKNNPWVAPVLTPEGEAMLPKTDEEVPGYLERVFVPYQERNKPVPVSKGGALYIPGKGFQTPPTGPEAPQKPFAVGGSVFFPDTNEFKTPPTAPETNKPSKEIENYEYYAAQQSKEGRPVLPFNDWLNQKNIPAPKTLTPAQEVKLGQDIGKDYQKLNSLFESLENVMEASADVRESPGLKGATGYGSYFPSFPEGEAAAAEVRMANLKGKLTTVGKEIKSMSGALGSMAVKEWEILRDTVSAFDAAIKAGESITKEQLDQVEWFVNGIKDRAVDAYLKQYSDYFDRFPQYSEIPSFEVRPTNKRKTSPVNLDEVDAIVGIGKGK